MVRKRNRAGMRAALPALPAKRFSPGAGGVILALTVGDRLAASSTTSLDGSHGLSPPYFVATLSGRTAPVEEAW